jgi:2-isopropylmalate synthase
MSASTHRKQSDAGSGKNRVIVFDTTLRDGEQSPGASMNLDEKIKIALLLEEMGIDVIEAGFPIASNGDFEAVREVAKLVKHSSVAGLSRATRGDIDRAWEALQHAKRPRIHTVIATSPLHMKFKLQMEPEAVHQAVIDSVSYARNLCEDVEWSCEDGSRSEHDFLCRTVESAIKAGAGTVNIPDTVGYSLPDEYGALIARVARALGSSGVVSVHCHDDLGLAVANSLAAVQNGARQIECTVNGIGERAGNCSLEEVVMALRTRRDRMPYEVGIETTQLFPASQLLTEIIGVGVQPNKAIVGRNAFAHEAGIHQDGYLKERTTYEIIDPKTVGVPESRLVLGKHSGRHALKARCDELGVALDRAQLDEVYRQFSALADRQKGILDEEIRALASRVAENISRKIA